MIGRCLVTGATGFIGSRLARRLVREGNQVHLLARRSADIAGATWHAYDGTCASVSAAVSASRPDVVFHLATHYVKDHADEDIAGLVQANVLFGIQLLDALPAETRCIVAGTTWQHLHCEERRPATLYAATKQAFEEVLAWYADARAIRAVTLHLGDTYGPDDPRPKLFALLARAAASGETLAMSPGEQLLDPLHVEDAATAFIAAAGLPPMPRLRTYWVAPGHPLTLRDLVSVWQRATGKMVRIAWGGRPYRDREVMVPWQGEPLPGWRALIPLERGLAELDTSR